MRERRMGRSLGRVRMANNAHDDRPRHQEDLSFSKTQARCITATLALVVASFLLAPCATRAQTPALIVDGDVASRLTLSLDELRAMRHQSGEVDDQGRRATYEGVPLTEILRRAGVTIGRAPLRGTALTSVVFVTGLDRFQAVFALAELDPAVADQRVLLADTRDGRSLSSNEGPLRIVAPGDKYPARWVRHVVRLTVARVTAPRSPN